MDPLQKHIRDMVQIKLLLPGSWEWLPMTYASVRHLNLQNSRARVDISTGDIDGAHPNTARVTLTDANGRQVSLLGSSIGGGNILVTEVNGMEVSLTGQYTTLIVLHKDTPGIIAAVTEVMAEEGINICNFRLSRQKKGGEAVMTIELDGMPSPEINKKINTLPNMYSSTMLQPI